MSETPAMSRTFGESDEFERRMRMVGQPPAQDNPLAELARLVGQEDPFRNLQGREPVRRDIARAAPVREPAATGYGHEPEEDFAAFDHEFGAGLRAAEEAGAPEEASVVHGLAAAPAPTPRAASAYPSVSIDNHRRVEPSPDAWAQGSSNPGASEGSDLVASRDDQPRESSGGSSRRTLVVLAAVVVLTGGGLAASFLARPSGSVNVAAASSLTAPTILAATGPSKVQPETAPVDPDAAASNSTLLDKNAGDGTATAKVVNSVEQPVDLTQAVKPAATAASDDSKPATANGFPEPKKVRTVTVRPDGTIVPNAPAMDLAAQGGSNDGRAASLAFDPRMSVPPAATPDQAAPPAAAETPAAVAPSKTTTRVPTMPKAMVSADTTGTSQADAAQDAAPVPPKAKPAKAAKAKPVQEAIATPDAEAAAPAAGSAGGVYAVQLGAPPTEAEAKEVSARLSKRFADQLGSYQPSIHKAESGSKSVFRIRVGNLSQDEAKALCAKLKAGGGGCFVARN